MERVRVFALSFDSWSDSLDVFFCSSSRGKEYTSGALVWQLNDCWYVCLCSSWERVLAEGLLGIKTGLPPHGLSLTTFSDLNRPTLL